MWEGKFSSLNFQESLQKHMQLMNIPASIYLFKVNYENTIPICEICSKLAIRTSEWYHWQRSGLFFVNFEQISHIVLVFPLVTLNKQMWTETSITNTKKF